MGEPIVVASKGVVVETSRERERERERSDDSDREKGKKKTRESKGVKDKTRCKRQQHV